MSYLYLIDCPFPSTPECPNAPPPEERLACAKVQWGREDANQLAKGRPVWLGRKRRGMFQDNPVSPGKDFVFILRPAEATSGSEQSHDVRGHF